MRILILSYAFPPQNAIGSHRPYSWARTWRDLGHEVEVLTVAKQSFDGALDLERDLSGIVVHEVGPRRSAEAKSAVRRALAWEKLKIATRRMRLALGIFADPRLLTYLPLKRLALRLAQARRYDFIIATSPPEIPFMVARAVARRTGIPWVADFRDLWFHDMQLYRSRVSAWLYGRLNRSLVASAALFSTVSQGLQQRLSRQLGRDVVVCYNGFFADEQRASVHRFEDSRRHIVYTGRVYPGKQGPEPLMRALQALRAEMPDIAARLAVDFYGFDNPWLRGLVARHGLDGCVTLHGFVPHRESIALQRAADALLFLDWMDVTSDGMLTGKLLEYLGSGRPILALGPRQDSEAAHLIASAGAGKVLSRESDIVHYLRALVSEPRAADVATEALERYSRERQAVDLLDAIRARLPMWPRGDVVAPSNRTLA